MVLMISLVMNTAFVAAIGYAYLHNPVRPRSVTRHLSERDHHFYELLGLSQAQMKKMIPMAGSFHERLNRLHADMAGKKDAMISELSGERRSLDQVETVRRQIATIQNKIQKTVIAHILDVKTILDADQQKRFFNLLRENMIQEHPMFSPPGEK
jgi:hypothetical protein